MEGFMTIVQGQNNCNFTPLHDYVLVVLNKETETKSAGGIFLTKQEDGVNNTGEVIKVGPGKKNDRGDLIPITDVKVGDIVVFPKYSAKEIKVINLENCLVIKNQDIVGILHKK
jgi:chaperonin GroES